MADGEGQGRLTPDPSPQKGRGEGSTTRHPLILSLPQPFRGRVEGPLPSTEHALEGEVLHTATCPQPPAAGPSPIYVLVVEDDPQMQRLLESQLTPRGYRVRVLENGVEALQSVVDDPPSVVLLDIAIPGGLSGIEVCRRIRTWSTVPIILVTAADAPHMKVSGLEYGADDYLTKPFDAGELMARIRAVLRRKDPSAMKSNTTLNVGDLEMDLVGRTITQAGEPVKLTRIEFDLLAELIRNGDRVLSYQHLQEAVWGHASPDNRPVLVHMCNLRRKVEGGPTGRRRIVSVAGIGYRFAAGDEDGE